LAGGADVAVDTGVVFAAEVNVDVLRDPDEAD
jgi:hypothetical protein